MIVIVYGLPGSGKTFFASRLAEKIKAIHLNSDVVRKQIAAWGKYSADTKENVYDVLSEKMRDAVLSGNDVVIDATFYKKKIRNQFLDLAALLKQTYKLIEVRASEETIKQRVSKPREDSQADFAVYQKIKSEFEPVEEDHLALDSEVNNIEEMIEKAVEYLFEI